jgi:hypothetical protein
MHDAVITFHAFLNHDTIDATLSLITLAMCGLIGRLLDCNPPPHKVRDYADAELDRLRKAHNKLAIAVGHEPISEKES